MHARRMCWLMFKFITLCAFQMRFFHSLSVILPWSWSYVRCLLDFLFNSPSLVPISCYRSRFLFRQPEQTASRHRWIRIKLKTESVWLEEKIWATYWDHRWRWWSYKIDEIMSFSSKFFGLKLFSVPNKKEKKFNLKSSKQSFDGSAWSNTSQQWD